MTKDKKANLEAELGPNAMTAAMIAVNPIAARAWMDLVAEGSRFVTDRLRQDLETQKAILECKTPAELLQVQTEFFKAAMEQYAGEASRFYDILAKATGDSIEDAESGHSRGYDDVPL